MSQELIFFDIDGTLSVPRYLVGNEYVPGFTEQGWKDYCLEHQEHIYDNCLPVEPVRRYAEMKKREGALLFVLSTVKSEAEVISKKTFIPEKYPGLFDDLLFVDADKKKIDVILELAERHGTTADRCELVEDTYSTLLYAYSNGIRITHVSSLVWNL